MKKKVLAVFMAFVMVTGALSAVSVNANGIGSCKDGCKFNAGSCECSECYVIFHKGSVTSCKCSVCGQSIREWSDACVFKAGNCKCTNCGVVNLTKCVNKSGDCRCTSCNRIMTAKCVDTNSNCKCDYCQREMHNYTLGKCTKCNVMQPPEHPKAAGEGGNLFGDVTGTGSVTVSDALEILKYLAGMKSILDDNKDAFRAALITGGTKPVIADALEILKYLAKMSNKVENSRWVVGYGGGK